MKKKVFLMAALATMMATATNAQTLVGEGPAVYNTLKIIPAEFTSDNQVKMTERNHDGNGTLTTGLTIYDNSITAVHQISALNICEARYADLDNKTGSNDVFATQTLFNSDDNYEYFITLRDERYNNVGLKLMSEDGSELWSWQPVGNNTRYVYIKWIVKWGGQYFFVVEEYDYDEYSAYIWYHIDRSTQSINRVEGNMPMNVFPTVADHSQTITVELGEGNNATEIQVVNSVGQLVKTIPVQPGQREVHLRANDLQSGLHIVGARSQDAKGACKIIVK